MTKPSTEPALALPCRFGPSYQLFDRIGTGGMAEIYLARGRTQLGATRLAVVKLVHATLAVDPKFASMLIAEAKLAARLSHTSIVQTYDLGREDGRLYIAMEYVEGLDLNDLLARCSRGQIAFPPAFMLHIVGETLRALDYAHRKRDTNQKQLGVVHRDVSPSNILVSMEGEVKLCDFGIARAMGQHGSDGFGEAIEGKAAYMSPEHARGETLDGRADVFAVSIVLWEMLAGRRLYRRADAPGKELLDLAKEAEVPPLPERGLPEHARLAAIVAKGLAKNVDERYATAHAMVRDLDEYARANGMFATPMRLGTFVTESFGEDLLARRRQRERAAAALERGPALHIQVLAKPPDDTIPDRTAPPPESLDTPAHPSNFPGPSSIVRTRPGAASVATPAPSPRRPSMLAMLALVILGVCALALGYWLARR